MSDIALYLILATGFMAYIAFKRNFNSRINELTLDLNFTDAEFIRLNRRFEDVKTRLTALEEGGVAPTYELTDFEKRIEQYKYELNTPTYPDNVTTADNPAVYSIPHEYVEDVPLRMLEEEEYAR